MNHQKLLYQQVFLAQTILQWTYLFMDKKHKKVESNTF